MEEISERAGEGKGDDRWSGPLEGVKLTAVCSAALASGEEYEVFDSGWVDAEGPGVERYVRLREVSTISCVARVMTTSGEVAEMQ